MRATTGDPNAQLDLRSEGHTDNDCPFYIPLALAQHDRILNFAYKVKRILWITIGGEYRVLEKNPEVLKSYVLYELVHSKTI